VLFRLHFDAILPTFRLLLQPLTGMLMESAVLDKIRSALDSEEAVERYLHMLKLATVGNMVGGLAHTLNNVLGGILGYAQLQKEELQDCPGPLKHAEIIERAAKRASKLISQLQMFCIRQSHTPRIIDPRFLVEQVYAILDSVFNKKVDLNIALQHGSAKIMVDVYALSFAFLNICDNAKDAMPHGGSLTIRTGLDAATTDDAHVDYVTCEFQDSGCGIEEEHMPQVTEPFFSTKDAPGMGLTIAQDIVRDHGGRLSIKSTPGKGTNVMVWIPVKVSAADIEVTASPQPNSRVAEAGDKRVIMVVDDEADLREMAKTILEHRGYRVLVAGSGHAAVEVFKEHADEIELIILDMIMPGMDGAEVYRHLRCLSQQPRFILTSGYVNDSPFQEIIDRGEERFVPIALSDSGGPTDSVFQPKTRRQINNAASRPARSAIKPATTACRVFLMPTAPKYTANT
jgi:signal transduction histidine kinase/CheY-like chemotaxis protein